jgi:hypothetical protein
LLSYLDDGELEKYIFIGYEMGYKIFSITDTSKPMLVYNIENSDTLMNSENATIRKVLFKKMGDKWLLAFIIASYNSGNLEQTTKVVKQIIRTNLDDMTKFEVMHKLTKIGEKGEVVF